MASIAASRLYAQLGWGEIQFVVQHDYVGQCDFVEALRFLHRTPGFIHESLRLQQDSPFGTESHLGDLPLEFATPQPSAMHARNLVDGEETDIVTVLGIAGAGIAEADDQAHGAKRSRQDFYGAAERGPENGDAPA
jgi:hypothetical protein